MIANMSKGILIVFDGIDGAGKTTQVNLLADALRRADVDIIVSKEPTTGKWGSLIRASATNGRLPLDLELDYFIKDRQEHIDLVIRPALEYGKIVILDRYYYSTIAYQGVRGARISEIREKIESSAIRPDITFILNCDVYTALGRIRHSRGDNPNEFENADYLTEVQKVFLSLCDIEPEIIKVNSQNSIGHIHDHVCTNLIDGPFKKVFCGKNYESECLYCASRMTDSCDWFNLKRNVRPIVQPEP